MAGQSEYNYLNAVDVLLERVPELRPVYQQLRDDEGAPVERVPELRPLYQQILDDDWLLFRPYGFFSRSARFVQQLAAQNASDPAVEDMLRRLAVTLEEMVTDDDQSLRDLMGAGFVEAMNPEEPGFAYLVGQMGPASRTMVVAKFGPDSV